MLKNRTGITVANKGKKCKRERLHLEGRRNTDITFMSFPPVHVCIGRLAWAATNELAPDSRACLAGFVHCVALSCLLGVLALLWVLDAVGICLVGTGELHNLCNRLFLVFVAGCDWSSSLPPQWCQELLQSGEDITEERPRPWHLSVVKSGYLSSLWCFQSFVHIRTFARN